MYRIRCGLALEGGFFSVIDPALSAQPLPDRAAGNHDH
jgi:hypothetical protein